MKIFPPFEKYTPKQMAGFISGIMITTLIWIAHYGYNYFILYDLQLDFLNILWPYVGIPLGVAVNYWLMRKINVYWKVALGLVIHCGSYIVIYLINTQLSAQIGLVFNGFGVGMYFGDFYWILLKYAKGDPVFGGRVTSLASTISGIFVIAANFLPIVTKGTISRILYIGVLTIFTLILLILGRNEKDLVPQEILTFRQYIREKSYVPLGIITLIIGFTSTCPFFAMVLMYYSKSLHDFNVFIIIFWITMMIIGFGAGLLLDTIGRRLSIIIGFAVQGIAFLLLTFVQGSLFIFIRDYIFPIVLTIGFAPAIFGMYLILFELPEIKFIRSISTINYLYMNVGMVLGFALPLIFIDPNNPNPYVISILYLFATIIQIVVIFQIKETLPSKSELQWRQSMIYISVLLKSGLPIFSYPLKKQATTTLEDSKEIFAGALTAITSILNEVAQSDKPLKVVKKEDFTLLIEDKKYIKCVLIATQDLAVLRQKLETFAAEFEEFFNDYLKEENTNLVLYSPAKTLVKKFFED